MTPAFQRMKDFAAIDFETATECRSSVCSVGVVIVRDGRIVDSFYSLITNSTTRWQRPGGITGICCRTISSRP